MFVMYYIYGVSVPSLLIESTDSMIIIIIFCNFVADVSIVVEILVFSTIRVHGQPIGPTNISRQIEDTNVIIPCPYSFISPPIWSIGGVLYDYSALPPPYATAAGGDLVITTIDDSLNNVSFQCIVTTIDGEILQSDIGILTVTGISNGTVLIIIMVFPLPNHWN